MPFLEDFAKTHAGEKEFLTAVLEVGHSLEPLFERHPEYVPYFKELLEPERVIHFDVKWVDDAGKERVNQGYRVQWCNAIGPYKGGLRFHPSVNLSILKMLAFEQTFKNALTGLPMGGGKGGSDFDPKGKSEAEVERFCRAFMDQLYPYIGIDTDVPAGDIGVGGREITYMYDEYKKKSGKDDGALTGKSLKDGGSILRPEATGYGLCYYTEALLQDQFKTTFKDKRVLISGSGNVATFACEKAQQLGAKVLTMSDSSSAVYDPEGIDLKAVRAIKEGHRGRIHEYLESHPKAQEMASNAIWGIPCDIALPCATQFEIKESDVDILIQNHCLAVCEGSNMSTEVKAAQKLIAAGVGYAPGKASNAGGVTVSGFEMAQNRTGEHWSYEQVDKLLKQTMEAIYHDAERLATSPKEKKDLITLSNESAFLRVMSAKKAKAK
jgi:glutamate dehydrogenase (NADP+)